MQRPVVIGAGQSACCEMHEVEEQLSRILTSQQFRSSPVLQTFLRFVVTKSVECQEESLTEHSIATEVFGRNSDFDSAADTVVRTQAYRLRQRLKEYYAGAGDADGLLIDVPKGHYKAAFSRRTATLDSIPLAPAARNDVPRNPVRIQRNPFTSIQLILAGLFLLITGVWAGRSLDFTTGAAHNSKSPSQADLVGCP